MQTFFEFFKRDEYESRKHLKLLKKVFSDDGMYSIDFTDGEHEEPYIYVAAPSDVSYQGLRVYQKGNILAFRVQKNPKTVPYGTPVEIKIQNILDKILMDVDNEDDAVENLNKEICKIVKDFFKQTKTAEEKILNAELSDDSLDGFGQITIRNADNEPTSSKASTRDPAIMRMGGTPYSNTFYNSNTSN